jgi:hypothetical protein
MLIPPTRFDAPADTAVYPKQPVVDDVKTDRGEFVEGKRIDSVPYVIHKAGDYTLPNIEINGGTSKGGKIETARLPRLHFNATPNPDYRPELPPEPEPVTSIAVPKSNSRSRYVRTAEALTASIALLLVIWRLWTRFGTRAGRLLTDFRRTRRNSERAFFAKLRRASRAGNAEDAYKYLLAWQARFRPGLTLSSLCPTREIPSFLAKSGCLPRSSMAGARFPGRESKWCDCYRAASIRHRKTNRSSGALPP